MERRCTKCGATFFIRPLIVGTHRPDICLLCWKKLSEEEKLALERVTRLLPAEKNTSK